MPIITTSLDHGKSFVTAFANANIALVKYWGKANRDLNIPLVPSISFTLNSLGTFCHVEKSPDEHDHLIIDGQEVDDAALGRFHAFLTYFRSQFSIDERFTITTKNNIPYGAGLASSASAYASMSLGLSHFCHLDLSEKELSLLARVGSASAARSIMGDFVALPGGEALGHRDAFASPIMLQNKPDWQMVIVIGNHQQKALSSREAMTITKQTSPFFDAFVKNSHDDFLGCKDGLITGNLETVGAIMEHSTLKMHASMWAAKPSINYLQPFSLSAIELIKAFRNRFGPVAFFTLDAGPNVKILCEAPIAERLSTHIQEKLPNTTIVCSSLGQKAKILDDRAL